MKHHLGYLKYVLTHKYWVFIGCRILGVSLWQALIHDWSKFLPLEWNAYVARFADGRGSTWESKEDTDEYRRAWRHHWSANPHHWEFWLDKDGVPAEMEERYVREMVADWFGAGSALGKPDIRGWYAKGRAEGRYTLHPNTRALVERLLLELP